jgi:hypothetical protein
MTGDVCRIGTIGPVMGIEHHLLGLARIGPHEYDSPALLLTGQIAPALPATRMISAIRQARREQYPRACHFAIGRPSISRTNPSAKFRG